MRLNLSKSCFALGVMCAALVGLYGLACSEGNLLLQDQDGGSAGAVKDALNSKVDNNATYDMTDVGLSIAEAGIGLEGGFGADINIDIGGAVIKAVLYWAGRDRPCPEDGGGACMIDQDPYLDQELVFEGLPIKGDIIGEEENFPTLHTNNIAYSKDVTATVQAKVGGVPGNYNFSLADGNGGLNFDRLDGAGLFVVYTDASDPATYRLLGADGMDFAFDGDPAAHARVTEPVTFMYDSIADARVADLVIFAGDAEDGREDRILITDNANIEDMLTGADGPSWNTETFSINIPGGVSETTVELVSPGDGSDPDSLLWTLGAIRIPIPACGDNILDPGEECDGTATGNCADGCEADCTCTPICGDDNLDAGEECDGTADAACPGECLADCTCPVPGGGEGCTPGYWKLVDADRAKASHECNWAGGFAPDTMFCSVFDCTGGDDFDGLSLLDVLEGHGGGWKALGRHTVAALLNAASDDVSYEFMVGEVISMFDAVWPCSGNECNTLKNTFAEQNEGVDQHCCPLGVCKCVTNGDHCNVTDVPGDRADCCNDDCSVDDDCQGAFVGPSDCCSAHGETGCEESECEDIVCDLDASCCDTEWTQSCADAAAANCCSVLCEGICTPADFNSTPSLAIPDVSLPGVSDVINVPGSFDIVDVNVDLIITHSWVGDLCVTLTHPDGTEVVLIQRPGDALPCDAASCCGCSANNYDIILDDGGAGGAIEDQCINNLTSPPGYWPDDALIALSGKDAQGNWTITVNDNSGADTGTLDQWSLHFGCTLDVITAQDQDVAGPQIGEGETTNATVKP